MKKEIKGKKIQEHIMGSLSFGMLRYDKKMFSRISFEQKVKVMRNNTLAPVCQLLKINAMETELNMHAMLRWNTNCTLFSRSRNFLSNSF